MGKRAGVEGHQLVIGALAAPPPRERIARRDKEIDQHGSSPKPELCTAKMGISRCSNHPELCIPAMQSAWGATKLSGTPLPQCHMHCAAARSGSIKESEANCRNFRID